ncbi:hypothetical protein Poli38472_008375 [Pythium oligandrum]|uniref:Crinkler effector protein N-terminal domain-containing protein n=1 Tax=Pythium oligandrum TaxID=41045 RepID=A0A8K1CMQ2_PYTOL|nr:hypothetical protein Poli38472_008375 [Pythium oligandrum]|eukprot:TMW65733.1 hypothetical protein Poli38472_008375 [Pythium oligandrum]
MTMTMKLVCLVMGMRGNAFPVDIEATELIGDLKYKIKDRKPTRVVCDGDELRLYTTRSEGGNDWLESQSADVKALLNGGIPERMTSVLREDIDPTLTVGRVFEGAPKEKAIHVLVKVPVDRIHHHLRDWGDMLNPLAGIGVPRQVKRPADSQASDEERASKRNRDLPSAMTDHTPTSFASLMSSFDRKVPDKRANPQPGVFYSLDETDEDTDYTMESFNLFRPRAQRRS